MKSPSLNHTYRLVWSDQHSAWIAVPESAKGRSKNGKRLLAAVLLAPVVALAAPTGGTVTSGSATISQSGTVTNINQSTQKAAINWLGFSIASNETVNFNQPNAAAITLNRVIGNERSVIDGTLNANGQVFLLNSNGVLIGKGGSINTAGFVASSLGLSDQDFMAGKYSFTAGSTGGAVINLGTITAKEGGYVALLGNSVTNEGVITATKGAVALSAGNKITLNFNGDSLLSVTLDEGALNALVENKQAIYADGGKVILTAKAADDLLGAQVNNTGIVQARTVDDLTGSISLYAHGGTTHVDGTLDASAPNGGNGGFIETSGDHVRIADSAVVTTEAPGGRNGTWLIDPLNFTIENGSAALTDSGIGAARLSASLANGNVVITTAGNGAEAGNINIDAAVSWSASNSLTLNAASDINVNAATSWSAGSLVLNAANNVYVNAAMTATGSANFSASYGSGVNADSTPMGLYTFQGGANNAYVGKVNFSGSGSVTLNGTAYTVIKDLAGLTAAKGNVAGNYVLGADLSGLTDIPGGSANNWSGAIGDSTAFTGNFNGFGHLISSSTFRATGLFGTIGTGGVVSNLGLTSASVLPYDTTRTAVGVLANENQGSIVNSFVGSSSSINLTNSSYSSGVGILDAGGLVGVNSGLIAQSYAMVNVGSTNGVTLRGGGLVGTNQAGGRIIDSSTRMSSTGTFSVTGTSSSVQYIGGLVGVNDGSILRSTSSDGVSLTGSANGATVAGGFVGKNTGTIDQAAAYFTNSAATSLVGSVAGFVGDNSGTISNAYTTESYMGNTAGGPVYGFAYRNTGTISSSYAIGTQAVNTSSISYNYYGFVGDNTNGTIRNSYWFTKLSNGTALSGLVTDGTNSSATRLAAPATTVPSAVTTLASYTGFDPNIWGAAKTGYPILRNLLVYVNTKAASIPVYGSATSTISTLGLQAIGLQGGGGTYTLLDALSASYNPFTVATDNGYVDAGTQAAANVLTSSPYNNIKGVITVTPKALTFAAGSVADKTYDGTTTAAAGTVALSGLVGSQTLALSNLAGNFVDKNAGAGKTVNLTYTVADGSNGGKASNYTLATTATATINKKTITATATGNSKVYDGTLADTLTWQLPGSASGDDVALAYTAAFADKNVGQNKAVSVSGLSLTGADAGNYILGTSSLSTTGNITPLALQLYGLKSADGVTSIGAASIRATNVVSGDQVTLTGSATIASAAAGNQPFTNLSGLTVNNPNYTLVGSVGSVVVGGANLVLDKVASGSATVSTVGNTTTVTQTTDKAVIDWMRFSVGANETLNFVQPSATSIVLNRVTSDERSVIDGALNANGRVFILNSNGVLFSATSHVNVAALLASTLNVSDANFNAGNYVFTGTGGTGSLVAQGDIVIVDGGFMALVSENGVVTSGSITAHGGKVLLDGAASLSLTLNTADAGLGAYAADTLAGAVTAGGAVEVSSSGNGGLVETAGASVNAQGLSLNTGTNGTWYWTQNGAISIGNNGTFSSAFAKASLMARNFTLKSINAGIAINDALDWSANTRLTLNAKTDIDFNAALTASGGSAGLVINHGGYATTGSVANGSDYHVNAPVTLSGANATLSINGNAYTLIHSMSQLDAMDGLNALTGAGSATATTGKYALAQDLDATATAYTDAIVTTLSGTLAGLGHTVSNLSISKTADNTGLIGIAASGSVIRDIGVVNATIAGNTDVGILAGQNQGTVSHAYASGTVVGAFNVGGLVGLNWNGTIADSHASASVGGSPYDYFSAIGGLVGQSNTGSILRSYATGNVTVLSADLTHNLSSVGGLVGTATNTDISDSYATGNVKTTSNGLYVGGLVGNVGGTSGHSNSISNSYATGNVEGGSDVGGLVGNIYTIADPGYVFSIVGSHASGSVTGSFPGGSNGGAVGGLVGNMAGQNLSIQDSYATGNVKFSSAFGDYIGGLVGNLYKGQITNSYATGSVTGSRNGFGVGALVGSSQYGSINHSYATGDGTSSGLVGRDLNNTSTISSDSYYRNIAAEATARAEAVAQAVLKTRASDATSKSSSLVQQATQTTGNPLAGALPTGPATPPLALSNRIVLAEQGFKADVKAITVDGVRFDLNKDSDKE